MPITQIISGPKTFTFTQNTGVVQYVNKYAMRLSIDSNNTTVTFNDFKNNVFDLDITQITVPTTFATVGELVNFLTGQNIYNSTSEWYHGDSDPDVSFGANSDYFLNRITGDIWNKVAGVWALMNSSSTNGLPSGTTTGTDTYAVTIPGITGYNINTAFTINFSNANTNGSTLDINGLGPIPIYKNVDEPLVGGDIKTGQEFICIYDGSNFQIIGIKPNQMFAFVSNVDTVPITKGMVVYAFGASGDRMSVKRALNTTDATSAKTVGLVYSTSIAVNGTGYIIMQGVIQGLNLGAFTAGDTLYLANTAGDYTNVKQYAPNHLVYVGIVERANVGNGQIYVRVQNGYELDELHDVQAQTPSAYDVLYYDNAVSQWKAGKGTTIHGKIYKDHTNATAVTGTTANTLVYSQLIPGGTFAVGDIVNIIYRARKVGTVGITTLRIYVNTTAAIAGGTLLATNATANTTLFTQITREAVIKTATNTEVFPAATAGVTDMLNATVAASALNIDWTTDKYFVFAIQNANNGDSTTASMYNIKQLE